MNENREVGLEDAMTGLGAGAGVLLGANSRIANLPKMLHAQRVYAQHVDRNPSREDQLRIKKEVWQQTGWFRDADGQWKFELPPTDTKFTFMKDPKESIYQGKLGVEGTGRLQDFWDFPALFDAHPGIENMSVSQMDFGPEALAQFSPQTGVVLSPSMSAHRAPGILGHEVQHAIQALSGQGSGANLSPAGLRSQFPELEGVISPDEFYARSQGENVSNMIEHSLDQSVVGGEPYSIYPQSRMGLPAEMQMTHIAPKITPADILQGVPGLQSTSPDAVAFNRTIPESALGGVGSVLKRLIRSAL